MSFMIRIAPSIKVPVTPLHGIMTKRTTMILLIFVKKNGRYLYKKKISVNIKSIFICFGFVSAILILLRDDYLYPIIITV